MVEKSTIQLFDRGLFVTGAKMWSSLLRHLQTLKDIPLFVKKIRNCYDHSIQKKHGTKDIP